MAGSNKTSFGLRAVHSLTGVVPVGAFMLLQLWAHAKALDGSVAYRAALVAVHPSSWASRILVLVPLLFHVGYGLVLTFKPRYNVGRYPLSRNWTYTLQRATGVIALGFIALYLVLFWNVGAEQLPDRVIGTLSQTHEGLPLVPMAFMFGLGACIFHFSVGLWMIGVRYGFTATRSSQAQTGMALAVIGLALFVWSGHTVVFVATGWSAVRTSGDAEDSVVCDPATLEASEPSPSSQVRTYPRAPK